MNEKKKKSRFEPPRPIAVILSRLIPLPCRRHDRHAYTAMYNTAIVSGPHPQRQHFDYDLPSRTTSEGAFYIKSSDICSASTSTYASNASKHARHLNHISLSNVEKPARPGSH